LWRISKLFRASGQTAEALAHCLRAVEVGTHNAMGDVIDLLHELGRNEEAEYAERYGIEPGGRIAISWGPGETGYESAGRQNKSNRLHRGITLQERDALTFMGAGSKWGRR
jgi:hypothetical protein